MTPEVQDDTAKAKQKVVKPTDLVSYEDGSIVSETIIDRKAVSVAVFAFDKYQGIVEHILPYDTLFYVLEGEAEIELSGKSCSVKSGEMILIPGKNPHAVNAKSKFKMLLLSLKE